jgi:hypothetical protein
MAEVQETVEKVQEKLSGGSGKSALTAAAAAAATTAATYAVRKKLSHDDHGRSNGSGSPDGGSKSKKGSGLLSSAASTGWDAASDVLLPLADDAAEAAGKYAAQHGPEVLRERIIPKFIEAFNDAK